MQRIGRAINTFLKHESASGILLIFAALLALALDNSILSVLYDAFLSVPVAIKVGSLAVDKPLLLWINDGLMAVFFFLIGLEIKRELIEGELSSRSKAMLPLVAAAGGLLVPAMFFVYFNYGNAETIHGWGIPIATDIAFALGVLALLGKRIPASLKILLLSLAIIDDIAGILVISIFYTEKLSVLALGLSCSALIGAITLNVMGVRRLAAYILFGIFMWVCLLKSGVHATLSGVALAFTIPLNRDGEGRSLLRDLEHNLHAWVAYMIMPVFAFANAGVSLKGVSLDMLKEPLSLGIICGLFFGKQIGVFSFVYLAVKARICALPSDIRWGQVYGLAVLTGIGFTMSLFIGTLAFTDPDVGVQVRLSVLVASALSAVCGYAILRVISPVTQEESEVIEDEERKEQVQAA